MKYILNETPIRTTNNFGINDLNIDLDIKETDFNKYKITNVNYSEDIKNNFNSKIGLKASNYYQVDIDVDKYNDEILIEYDFTNDNNYLASKINLNLLDSSISNIIIKFKSDIKSINNTNICINALNNSNSNITIVNMLDKDSKSFISIENYQKENSNITINFVDLGSDIKVSNYYSNLNEDNSINNFNNIYVGNNNDRIDMNYYLSNKGKNTKGNMIVNGALNDNAYKTFKGTIDFNEGCTKSIGNEEENVVLLSDNCKSKSLPMLLCHEEDVNGAHGISTGKIDENKLFYLMSKGISLSDSKKLLIHANFNKILNNINNISLRNEIEDLIDSKI